MSDIMKTARRESAIETMYEVWSDDDVAKDLTKKEAVDYLVNMMVKEPDFWGVTTREEVEKEIYKCYPELLLDDEDSYYKYYRQGVMEELIKVLKAMELIEIMGKDLIIEYLVNQIMKDQKCKIYNRKQAKNEAEHVIWQQLPEQ
jgi:hypothetical protein